MIIIPELETVVILTPRTGSGSLRRAIRDTYPKAFMPYRHMEADGVLRGYDRWRRVGVVRRPVARLWSLYKFLKVMDDPEQDPAYIQRMRDQTNMSFSDWIVHNEIVFTSPYSASGSDRFYPQYTVNHSLPENRKSQFVYLRPDLGTEIYQFSHMINLYQDLRLPTTGYFHNATGVTLTPGLSVEAENHMERFFAWDFGIAL